jgi:hypothetical protein
VKVKLRMRLDVEIELRGVECTPRIDKDRAEHSPSATMIWKRTLRRWNTSKPGIRDRHLAFDSTAHCCSRLAHVPRFVENLGQVRSGSVADDLPQNFTPPFSSGSPTSRNGQ